MMNRIDTHFKKHLGTDYFAFYLDWFLLLTIPTLLLSVFVLIARWIGGVE